MKSIMTRGAKEWDNFLNSILEERKQNGKNIDLKKPELERLILHSFLITQLREDMINLIITKREEAWMRP